MIVPEPGLSAWLQLLPSADFWKDFFLLSLAVSYLLVFNLCFNYKQVCVQASLPNPTKPPHVRLMCPQIALHGQYCNIKTGDRLVARLYSLKQEEALPPFPCDQTMSLCWL